MQLAQGAELAAIVAASPSDHAGVALTLGVRPSRSWLADRPRGDRRGLVTATVH